MTQVLLDTAADRVMTGPLVDRHGRVATDLRVSLTDRCNLRCTYCMPAEGLEWMPDSHVLTDDEMIRLIAIAVEQLGVREVRFTGGEPLLRRGLERLIAETTALRTHDGVAPETSITTNGLGLAHRAAGLAAAGLSRVNVSLDTLDRERYATITRRDRLPAVLAGLEAADRAGLRPVKINTVLMRGVNDDEAVDLLRWSVDHGYHLRFIEQMPLGPRESWDRTQMVTAAEILASLRTGFDLTEHTVDERGAAPAQTWTVDGGGPDGTWDVGVVASVTGPFCGSCDRVRLTSDGRLRNCLFAHKETDLLELVRSGMDDATLAEAWRTAMWGKRRQHGIDTDGFVQPRRPMSAIGG
ncbi:GTP 3',8-cyclase MoaA [Cellulomonas sp. P22]|uniref:GTP 3',8-cyclase MoaA n=1 Tax=Cellulomonas sp. P22 TaxID=3373189 RepID=UPI0037B85CA8